MKLFKEINIQGQNQTLILLKKMFPEGLTGRTVIFSGPKGTGKWTTALSFAARVFSGSPFDSPDFSFYRNDNYLLKTKYYLSESSEGSLSENSLIYFLTLCARYGRAVSLGEITKADRETMFEIENTLKENGSFPQDKKINTKWQKTLLAVSETLGKKQRFPIDFIRQIINEHHLKPNGSYKISVLADFDKASVEAQNASLKILEEPPKSSVIIITAENPKRLLPTILSRSLIFHFRQLNREIVSKILNDPENIESNIPDAMKEKLYRYREKSREYILSFFQKIAPTVQNNFDLFTFIDELISDQHPELVLYFLSELADFIRALYIDRQSLIRNDGSLKNEAYASLFHTIPVHTYISELREISSLITQTYSQINRRNMKAKLLLPDLLINIARWYQKRAKK